MDTVSGLIKENDKHFVDKAPYQQSCQLDGFRRSCCLDDLAVSRELTFPVTARPIVFNIDQLSISDTSRDCKEILHTCMLAFDPVGRSSPRTTEQV
jgi:hypothetical protein